MTVKLSIETPAYNERRYGRPWIAKVDFSNTPQGEFLWGEWIGDAGYPGLLEIKVEVGDIIAKGQKDHRSASVKPADYFVVTDTGYDPIHGGKAAALKVWRENHKEAVI
jgi:hypothetical protein